MITPLDFPKAPLRLKRINREVYVWCIIRKLDLLCTPEEWVRQHVIHYLINEKKIPVGLIVSEYSLKYNGVSKRADVVVLDRSQNPILIIECKAPEIAVNDKVMYQIAQYNAKLNANYLFLTNGLKHIVCQVNDGNLTLLDELPDGIV